MTDEATAATSQKGKTFGAWQEFQGELQARESEIAAMLPTHVTKERFLNSALAAVKQTPELLRATPRTLFSAITKSAQDGILPDGREGVITVYNTSDGHGGRQDVAQWNPMTHGLRKRARELDNIGIDAQVVYENDRFIWHQGDEPKIEHIPVQLGKPRGEKIGAYAIFKREGGPILHREVMDCVQIEAVRSQSRQPDGLMWSKFPEEAYRKTVIRRGMKSVPVSEKLEEIIRRNDEDFDFEDKGSAVIAPPRPTKANEFTREPTAKPNGTNGKHAHKLIEVEAKPGPDEIAEKVAAKDEVKAEVKPEPELPPIVTTPSNVEAKSNTPAEREPGDDTATENTAAQELEQWYRDQVAEIEKSPSIKDLTELRDMVVQNVDDTQAAEFKKLCGTRAMTMLKDELALAKTVRQVTDLRGKHAAVLSTEMANWFMKLCDDKQRVMLDATRKAKQK